MKKYSLNNIGNMMLVVDSINKRTKGKTISINLLEKETQMSKIKIMRYIWMLLATGWLFIPKEGFIRRI